VRVPFSIEEAVDPEEALVAAAASCHMLTFLWVAAKRGFNIASYEDNAVGEMTKEDDGTQWISRITLDPQVAWSGETRPSVEEIAEMHHEAHRGCYIANSIKSEVIVTGI
jgi:organic hydroperoxide reductase OsmC/OhrA